MKNAVRVRRGRVLALCFAALAVIAVAWSASAPAAEEEIPAGYARVGNSFARFSSKNVEVFSPEGELLYSLPFEYAQRTLTPSGEGAAAWAPGSGIFLLGEGGYRYVAVEGELLGVFGSSGGGTGRADIISGQYEYCRWFLCKNRD